MSCNDTSVNIEGGYVYTVHGQKLRQSILHVNKYFNNMYTHAQTLQNVEWEIFCTSTLSLHTRWVAVTVIYYPYYPVIAAPQPTNMAYSHVVALLQLFTPSVRSNTLNKIKIYSMAEIKCLYDYTLLSNSSNLISYTCTHTHTHTNANSDTGHVPSCLYLCAHPPLALGC